MYYAHYSDITKIKKITKNTYICKTIKLKKMETKNLLKSKTKKVLFALFIAVIGAVTMNTAKAQTYDPLAVQRINDLIANNGLKATPDAPETWTFATWNDEIPKQLTKLELIIEFGYMSGTASFAGLTALQTLYCQWGYLTKLDVTNCTQLQMLTCGDNRLTEIDLTNCDQLLSLNCQANLLTKLEVTNCTLLQTLRCSFNNLMELDLSGLDNLTIFEGDNQYPPEITLYKNETDEYTCSILLNNPIFESDAISYSNGILKSNNNTILYTMFTIQTNKDGFELSGEMKFIYSTVGIEETDSSSLSVYPNPTSGELMVTSYGLQVTGVEVLDINGKKQQITSKKQNIEDEMIIDISYLPAGIYFVKIVTEQGDVVRKIVKQ